MDPVPVLSARECSAVKLTVLMDNHTLIGQYLAGEPAASYLIEEDSQQILFDVGYSDAYIANARKLSLDLLKLDFVVLSHGHLDHTWGLAPLLRLFTEGLARKLRVKTPRLVTHPLTFATRTHRGLPEIGSLLREETLARHFHLQLSRAPVHLTEHLVYLGEIDRKHDFEGQRPLGKILEGAAEKDDFLLDDSALAYRSPEGLVIITGCSHAGICNIVEHAKGVCDEDRVVDIIGGFHLLRPSREQLQGTVAYMRALRPRAVHACHCTDLASKIALADAVDLKEVGVGLTLEY
jgi:7,8-dihydropterin-6-yl-methyl-4-(beta-D-ribofuranosyl)aminobenzene 5'-phosphate synthase